MAVIQKDPKIEKWVRAGHGFLSAAASYKRGIGVLPALVKLAVSVGQFALSLLAAIISFGNSGITPYMGHAYEEGCEAIGLIIRSITGATHKIWIRKTAVSLKQINLSDLNFQKRVQYFTNKY